MYCIQPDAHVYELSSGKWLIGDVHKYGKVYILRVSSISDRPLKDRLSFLVGDFMSWFDRGLVEGGKEGAYSSMVVDALRLVNYGWEGVSTDAFQSALEARETDHA